MTNNKQQTEMKLYTEEEIKRGLDNPVSFDMTTDEFINSLTPIEFPSYEEIWRWWQTQKFQKEQGEQEYTMLYEIDLPKILKAFIEHFSKTYGGGEQ
jgi:hypothetical protein